MGVSLGPREEAASSESGPGSFQAFAWVRLGTFGVSVCVEVGIGGTGEFPPAVGRRSI